MTIDRMQTQNLVNTLRRADLLKEQVVTLSQKVADLDNVATLDQDARADSIRVEDTVPSRSAWGRLFSSESPVSGQVSVDPSVGQPTSASLETSHGLLSRARYELSTAENGDQTVSMTELHPIGEELMERYTFHANGTVSVETQNGRPA